MAIRIHNEWFMPVKVRTCPCGEKKIDVFSWGQYVFGKYRKIDNFCKSCFKTRIIPRLSAHANDCGCLFKVNARATYKIPPWIKLPKKMCEI